MTFAHFVRRLFFFKGNEKSRKEQSAAPPLQNNADDTLVAAAENVAVAQEVQTDVSQVPAEWGGVVASVPVGVTQTQRFESDGIFCGDDGDKRGKKEECCFVSTRRQEFFCAAQSSEGGAQCLDILGSMNNNSDNYGHGAGGEDMSDKLPPSPACVEPKHAVHLNRWMGFDVDDDELNLRGSTLDEPITPQSYSSIMMHSEFKSFGRYHRDSFPRYWRGPPRSPSIGQCPHFEVCDGTDNSVFRRVQDETFESFQLNVCECRVQTDCIPPEPKELMNANVGRSRSLSRKGDVVECKWIDKRVVGNHQKLLNEKYVIYSKWNLGVGSYSKVVLCCNLEDKLYYAMKVLDRVKLKKKGIGADCALHKVKREIAIMKKLRHDNIVTLFEVIDHPSSRKIYLVLELAERGEIMSMRGDGAVIPTKNNRTSLPEHEVVRVIRGVVSAAMYAHRLGIAHRDIKPQNILLTADGDVKLSDFGVSIIVDDSAAFVRREGSVAFLPPEMLVSSVVEVVPLGRRSCCSEVGLLASSLSLSEGANMEPDSTCSQSQGNRVDAKMTFTPEEAGCPASAPVFTSAFSAATDTHSSSTSHPVPPQVDLFKADVFALGVTTFVLLMGRLPWRACDACSQLNAIFSEQDPFEAAFCEAYGDSMSDPKRPFAETQETHVPVMLANDVSLFSAMSRDECDEVAVGGCSGDATGSGVKNSLNGSACDAEKTGLDSPVCPTSLTLYTSAGECGIHTDRNRYLMDHTDDNELELEKRQLSRRGDLERYSLRKISNCSRFTRDVSESYDLSSVTTTSMDTTFATKLTHTGFDQNKKPGMILAPQPSQPLLCGEDAFAASSPSDSDAQCCYRLRGCVECTPSSTLCLSSLQDLSRDFREPSCASRHTAHHDPQDPVVCGTDSCSEKKNFVFSAPQNTTAAVAKGKLDNTQCMRRNFFSLINLPALSSSFAVAAVDDKSNHGASDNNDVNVSDGTNFLRTEVPGDICKIERSLPATKTHGPISADAIDFVRRCLNVDPAKRSTMEELYHHPWIQKLLVSEQKEEKTKVEMQTRTTGASATFGLTNMTRDLRNAKRAADEVASSSCGDDFRQMQPVKDNKIVCEAPGTMACGSDDSNRDVDDGCRSNPVWYSRGTSSTDVAVPNSTKWKLMRLQKFHKHLDTRVVESLILREMPNFYSISRTFFLSAFVAFSMSPSLRRVRRRDRLGRVSRGQSGGELISRAARTPASNSDAGQVNAPCLPSSSFPLLQGPCSTTEDLADAVTRATNSPRLLCEHEAVPVPFCLAATLWERRSARVRPPRRRHFDETPLLTYSRDDTSLRSLGAAAVDTPAAVTPPCRVDSPDLEKWRGEREWHPRRCFSAQR